MSLIQLREVSKEYNKHSILDDVNIAIEEGDLYGIIGESGSGKTTLLNLITGFINPSNGTVHYQINLTQRPRNLRRDLHEIKKILGFTPQHSSFYPKLTVKENLIHFGKLYGLKRSTLITNGRNLLKFTKLFEHRNKLAENLSEGMQRRLDIACSLIHRPKVLVLDEPTADLDPLLQKEILFLLQQVNKQGITIIIASHHLDSIDDICNKVAIIHQGKVHSHGLLDDIKKPFLKEHVTINLRPGSNKELLMNAVKTLPVEKIIEKGNQLIIYPDDLQTTVSNLLQIIKDENLYLNDMDVRKPSLGEIFEVITKK